MNLLVWVVIAVVVVVVVAIVRGNSGKASTKSTTSSVSHPLEPEKPPKMSGLGGAQGGRASVGPDFGKSSPGRGNLSKKTSSPAQPKKDAGYGGDDDWLKKAKPFRPCDKAVRQGGNSWSVKGDDVGESAEENADKGFVLRREGDKEPAAASE